MGHIEKKNKNKPNQNLVYFKVKAEPDMLRHLQFIISLWYNSCQTKLNTSPGNMTRQLVKAIHNHHKHHKTPSMMKTLRPIIYSTNSNQHILNQTIKNMRQIKVWVMIFIRRTKHIWGERSTYRTNQRLYISN